MRTGADPASASSNTLALVQTASPGTQTSLSLPGGALPVADGNGNDQFVVSPDGKWIAVIAGTGVVPDALKEIAAKLRAELKK